MIARLLILVVIGYTMAQGPSTETTTANPKITTTTIATTTTTSTTTPTLSSSSPSSSSSSSTPTVSASMGSPQNCSACMQQFQKIYLNARSNQTSNETSASAEHFWNDSMKCPPIVSLNDPCVSIVNTDNCSVILNLIYTASSNVSFGLTCTATGMRVVKWANCTTGGSETLRFINESNENFCRMGGGGGGGGGAAGLNCSVDDNGIRRINKVSVLEPFRKMKYCAPPTTGKPTIPLLPNPVGPSAITAIVVLVCLFITAVLAGFFFWPKCHMSKPPPPTKKQPTPEAFNVVAYSAATHSPTGAANVSISVGPNQLGPAAA